jgi:polysaccharide export outer membrane protein
MKRRRLAIFAALFVGSLLVPLAVSEAQVSRSGQAEAVPSEDYRIGLEDTLTIVVWKNETLSRPVTVRPDGKISLPLVNDIQAAGLTPSQLRTEITRRLTEFMPTPEVSVMVNEVRSFKISVLGEVQKPGRYDLRSRTTVLDALALAGGFKDFASPNKIVILRSIGKTTQRLPFNYKRAIAPGGEGDNFELLPNDVILVP